MPLIGAAVFGQPRDATLASVAAVTDRHGKVLEKLLACVLRSFLAYCGLLAWDQSVSVYNIVFVSSIISMDLYRVRKDSSLRQSCSLFFEHIRLQVHKFGNFFGHFNTPFIIIFKQ